MREFIDEPFPYLLQDQVIQINHNFNQNPFSLNFLIVFPMSRTSSTIVNYNWPDNYVTMHRVVKYVKFSPKSTAYLVSEKSTRIFLKKYVNDHQYSNFKIKILGC